MTPESFIAGKAVQAIKALYNADMEASALQVQVTRKEVEGDFTLVVFPLLKVSHSSPDNTGSAIGGWFMEMFPRSAASMSSRASLTSACRSCGGTNCSCP